MSPSPELLRCRVPDSTTYLYGTALGIGASGFLYSAGGASGPDAGYIVPRDGSITAYTVWVDAAVPRVWTVYADGSPLTLTPSLDTTAGQAYDTYQIGQYPVTAGQRIQPAYVGVGGGPATNATGTIEVTFS